MIPESEAMATVDRLLEASNSRDVDGIVACFSPDYRNETPVHPKRGFVGNDQVRRNWTAILGAVPDHHAEITARVADGDIVWTEWRMGGTRPDGTRHEMVGVVIFTVGDDGLFSAARFYLEPVETDSGDVADLLAREFAETEARP